MPASVAQCLTGTSLHGDRPARLLAGVEALNGLLLIGWSASFTYLSMEKFWAAPGKDERATRVR